MRGILLRILEGAGVALGVAAVVGLVSQPATARSVAYQAVVWVGDLSPSYSTASWATAITLGVLGLAVLVRSFRNESFNGSHFWEFELRMPSWPTTLLGAAATFSLVAAALQLCEGGTVWGFLPLIVATWIVVRFMGRMARGWQALFGLNDGI